MADNSPQNSRTDKSSLPNYRWIKFEIEYLNEPDFMQLSEAAAGAYLKLYLMAGKADAGGLLCNSNKVFTLKDLSWFLRCSTETLAPHLEELTGAGFMVPDGEGFRIARFLEEQGPGDNNQRKKWNERQKKHRARARGEKELEQEKEEEAEEEVEVDIECHGDITVTQEKTPPPPPAAATPLSADEIIQNYWKQYTGRTLGKKKLEELEEVIQAEIKAIPDWESRLRDCLSVWKTIATIDHKGEGWSVSNPDAIMELYPIPNLEERMEREDRVWNDAQKEAKRKDILKQNGFFLRNEAPDNADTGNENKANICPDCGEPRTIRGVDAWNEIMDALFDKHPEISEELAASISDDMTGECDQWCRCELEEWKSSALAYAPIFLEGKRPLAALPDDYGRTLQYFG